MKYALIGCGRISVNHIAAAQENGLDIVAVCDIVPERMQLIAKQFSLPQSVRFYEDYRELLKQEYPELAAICTESGEHAHIAVDCIEAGCNVIIEKPIALSLADADRIIESAREHGVKVCACHQNRFNKSIQKIREAVESGRFGKMFHAAAHIRWNRGADYYKQAPWRGTWAQDGGALMNQCIHNIDLLRWMMGDAVSEVTAYTSNLNHPYIEAEDLGLALVRFESGAYGLIEGSVNIFPSNLEETLYLFGQNGTVKAGGKSVNQIEEWKFADGLDDGETVKRIFHEDPPNVYGYGHAPLYMDMIGAIRDDRQPYIGAQDGRRALELVLGIYRAAHMSGPVKFPLDAGSTLDYKTLSSGG